MRAALCLVVLIPLLAGCEREPRAVEYFEANPGSRAEVLADCRTGTHRGGECDNARLAQQTVQVKNRRQRAIDMLEKQIEK